MSGGEADVCADAAPASAALAELLPSLIHDLRGPATALSAFCQLLAEDVAAPTNSATAGYLQALEANSELLAHVTDGLALLAAPRPGSQAPLGEVVLEVAARWQKVLGRSGHALNLSGDFPDSRVGRRALRVVLACLVHACAQAAEGAGPVVVTLAGELTGGRTLMRLSVAGPEGGESAAARPVRLAEAVRDASNKAEFMGAVLTEALKELQAVITLEETSTRGGTVVLGLPAADAVRPEPRADLARTESP